MLEVNTTGVLFTAQAAGRQMARFGRGGSIILIASMSGSITNRVSGHDGGWGETELWTGPRVGVVQHVQVCGAADGAEHGLRARGTEHPGEHALARTHIHPVSGYGVAVQVLTGSTQDDGGVPGRAAAAVRQVVEHEPAWAPGTPRRAAGCCDVARVGCVELLHGQRVGDSSCSAALADLPQHSGERGAPRVVVTCM